MPNYYQHNGTSYVHVSDYAAIEARLAEEVKNKKEFERDWLAACDELCNTRSRLAESEAENARLVAANKARNEFLRGHRYKRTAMDGYIDLCESRIAGLKARLAEAEALLRVMPGYGLSAYDKGRWEKARNALLGITDSAAAAKACGHCNGTGGLATECAHCNGTGSASGNRCAYCGVPDGDGHTGDCQHPALSDQPGVTHGD